MLGKWSFIVCVLGGLKLHEWTFHDTNKDMFDDVGCRWAWKEVVTS
jgi:hypothetical protein